MVEDVGDKEGEDDQSAADDERGEIAAVEVGCVAAADDLVHSRMSPLAWLAGLLPLRCCCVVLLRSDGIFYGRDDGFMEHSGGGGRFRCRWGCGSRGVGGLSGPALASGLVGC